MQPYGEPHVFVYLVTHPSPMDFRLFLLRHTALLRVLFRWTIRLLLPRQLAKARTGLLHAAREHLATPAAPVGRSSHWSGSSPSGNGSPQPGAGPADETLSGPLSAYRAPQYRALYRQWLDDPENTLWMAGSRLIADNIERGHGQVECVELVTAIPPSLSPG